MMSVDQTHAQELKTKVAELEEQLERERKKRKEQRSHPPGAEGAKAKQEMKDPEKNG